MLRYRPDLKDKPQRLRQNITPAEIIVWSKLKGKQIRGVQFYRQRPIRQFIVDFFAPQISLVIEFDGSQHFGESGEAYDLRRDANLKQLGMKVLRFSNTEVFQKLPEVLAFIDDQVYERLLNQFPPLKKGD